jgi:hypothetical protein
MTVGKKFWPKRTSLPGWGYAQTTALLEISGRKGNAPCSQPCRHCTVTSC